MKKNLLIQEPPLQVLPTLAKIIGLNESIALQQLHYWLENKFAGVERDGLKWIYNTYETWQEDNFPFWSIRTIQRVFLSLEKMGLVISAQFDKENYDRRKYYRIDYTVLGTLEDDKLALSEDANLARSLNESETTTETTSLTNEQKNQILAKSGIEWKILSGEKIEQEQIDENIVVRDAVISFETCLNFGELPWSSNPVWTKFEKFVIAEYKKDGLIWEKYATWRTGEGQYKGAMTNPKIHQQPQVFMASSFPAFLAHTAMYSTPKTEVKKDANNVPMSYG